MKPKKKIWDKKYIHVCLNSEFYPDELIEGDFFILTKEEIKKIIIKTKRRISLYNKRYRPRGYATYGGYGTK